MVRLLIDKNANIEQAMDVSARVTECLIFAVGIWNASEDGRVDMHVSLISLQNGATPLHLAAEKGHLDVARLLMDKNANVDQAMDVSACVTYDFALGSRNGRCW